MVETSKTPAPMDKTAKKWLAHIAAYDKRFGPWMKRAKSIAKRYRDFDDSDAQGKKTSDFNILWSNVQVLMPATFARLPKPDVSRRFRDNDPVGRVASLLLERALAFEIEHYPDYKAAMKNAVLDRFLGGRGTAWVRYEPHITSTPGQEAPAQEGMQITDDADEADSGQEVIEELAYECAPVDYVHWCDFGHTAARTWEEVTGIWRRTYLTREKLTERFGEKGATVPLDSVPDSLENSEQRPESVDSEQQSLACVYEIWDKCTSSAVWITKGGMLLDEQPDPLQLENFFPCPLPLYATTTTDNLVPVPDYKMYQDQATQLDKLNAKIDGLITMLVVKGVYDSAVPELARLFKEAGNGDLIPVKNFAQFAEKNGLKGSIDIYDISPIVVALNQAYETLQKVMQQIYELMGVSDIQRGASDPTETYGAQKLKGQYGNMRLRNKQDEVASFATDLLKIKAQIICQHFQPQTLLRCAAADQLMPEDQQLIPQALQLLMGERAQNPEAETVDGPLAAFRVEVSSDSMIQMDERQEQASGMEFIQAVSGFMKEVMPAIQTSPEIAPLAVGLLKFGVTRFKVGKQVEGMIDQILDQLLKQAAQPQPPKPDPEMAKVQAQIQLEDKKLQNAMELGKAKVQSEAALQANEQQEQAKQNAHQNELEAQRAQMQAQMDAQLEQMRIQSEGEKEERQRMYDRWKEELQAAVKIEVANISSKAKLQDQATAAAESEITSEVQQ